MASRTTALHGRSLCVGPPWSGSHWDRPATPGEGQPGPHTSCDPLGIKSTHSHLGAITLGCLTHI